MPTQVLDRPAVEEEAVETEIAPLLPVGDVLTPPPPTEEGFVPVRFTNVKFPDEVIFRPDTSTIEFYGGIGYAKTPEDARLIRERVPHAYEERYGAPLIRHKNFVTTRIEAYTAFMERE